MLLLRTLVLERSNEEEPLNGALLCAFAVPQIHSNFLVYSLDEETEPGSARVYVAALRKKLERYFLNSVDAQEDLHVAMRVFKQILTLAASGAKPANITDTQIPYHFVDLKGCKLPPARPEDHHSVIIKKALVMKVITLGASAPVSAAVESATLIVPSIRFSSKMVPPPRVSGLPEKELPPLLEHVEESPPCVDLAPQVPAEQPDNPPPTSCVQAEQNSLFEVDSTLTSLARVAQELAQQKAAAVKQEEALERWFAQLQQSQSALERERQDMVDRALEKEAGLQLRMRSLDSREARLTESLNAQQHEQEQMNARADALERRGAELYNQELVVRQKEEKVASMLAQLREVRHNHYAMLRDFDQALDGLIKPEQAPMNVDLTDISL